MMEIQKTVSGIRIDAHKKAQIRVEWVLIAAVVAAILEGAARKWLIPGTSPIRYFAYFSKDIILACGLLVYVKPRYNPLLAKASSIVRMGIGITILGTVISLSSGINTVGAVFTIRTTVVLPMLALLIASKLRTQTIFALSYVILAAAVLNAPLGGIQYASPPGSAVNKYANETEYGVATAGEKTRATGTFSYINGFGVFGSAAICSGLILICKSTKLRDSQMGYGAISAGLICVAATVSRGVALATLIQLLCWILFARIKQSAVLGGILVTTVLVITLFVMDATDQAVDILTAAQRRHSEVSSGEGNRIINIFNELLEAIDKAPLGTGVGTQQVVGVYAKTGVFTFASVETEWARVVMETGVFGFVGFSITYFGVVYVLMTGWWQKRGGKRDDLYFAVALTCGIWVMGGVAFNHVSSFFFWVFAAGALAYVPESNAPQRTYRKSFANVGE